jgi:CubicO group peptidase (beta-lactamase class C family)
VLKKSQLELVTTRHVLSHTAGFPNWPSKEQPLKTHFVPGDRFAYQVMLPNKNLFYPTAQPYLMAKLGVGGWKLAVKPQWKNVMKRLDKRQIVGWIAVGLKWPRIFGHFSREA